MPSIQPIVLSASRRTDIPAFYMPWFMEQIGQGYFDVPNPYNRTISRVEAGPDRVHTIVFWSKNFGPFLDGGFGERLQGAGYGLFFNFTVNSTQPQLEPRVPSLDVRLGQLARLADRFGPDAVQWRFDPICFFKTADDGFTTIRDNRGDFELISDAAAQCGLTRCITSFMDHYAKIDRRCRNHPDIRFVDVSPSEKAGILTVMARSLAHRGMVLHTCCESDLLGTMGPLPNLVPGACIPSHRFPQRTIGHPPLNRDPGQRRSAGCGCRISRDIGIYADHPCHHNCLFCYANPAMDSDCRSRGMSCESPT